MTAKEMFEQLGYERFENPYEIEYRKDDREGTELGELSIEFTSDKFTSDKTMICSFYGYDSKKYFPLYLTKDEFKAIHQQLKELGWLDE